MLFRVLAIELTINDNSLGAAVVKSVQKIIKALENILNDIKMGEDFTLEKIVTVQGKN